MSWSDRPNEHDNGISYREGDENINLASIRWATEIIFVNKAFAIAVFISPND